MFQNFKNLTTPDTAQQRIADLRAFMKAQNLDAIFIPREDEYLGEYVPECAERLAWLTSFTGSAGYALILQTSAHIFVDGRYSTQIREQCDNKLFTFEDMIKTPVGKWIEQNAQNGLKLGLDPWTSPSRRIEELNNALKNKNGKIIFLDNNPIDEIWYDQPAPPNTPVSIQTIELSGQLSKDKIANIQQMLKTKNLDAVILADPTSIAWAFNIRGNDVIHTPLPHARAIIYSDNSKMPEIFIAQSKLGTEETAYLTQLADIDQPDMFEKTLVILGNNDKGEQQSIMIDPSFSSHAIAMLIKQNGGRIVDGQDPTILPRAIKNQTELEGAIAAHTTDGVAMVKFCHWLSNQSPQDLDEIKAAQKLESLRVETGKQLDMPLREISFDTISATGPNAALPHYRVNEASNRNFKSGDIYLVDSGAQYDCGTTDITRTIGLGDVSDEKKTFFTYVLKGMIGISVLKFPKGTRGSDIDVIARMALWNIGCDYAHGTGHGVGSYLSVHEGPQGISKRATTPFEKGMIISNEPGYYREGAFGIRIENLIYVDDAYDLKNSEIPMMEFQTLTLCPIDKNMILKDLLSADEIIWLNNYHQWVQTTLSPMIKDQNVLDWLKQATAPLS